MVAASTMGPAGADHAEGGHHDHDHDHEEGKVTTEATLSADADEAEAADEADVDAKGDSDKGATFSKKLPVRLGSDGRPLLFAPKLELCQKRKQSWRDLYEFLYKYYLNLYMCIYINMEICQKSLLGKASAMQMLNSSSLTF